MRPLVRGPPQAPPARRPGRLSLSGFSVRQSFVLVWLPRYPTSSGSIPHVVLMPNQPNASGFSAFALPAPSPPAAGNSMGCVFCAPTGSTLLAVVGLRLAFSGAARCARSWPFPCSARDESALAAPYPEPTACGRGGPIPAGMGGRPRLGRWPSWDLPHSGTVLFPSAHDFSLLRFACR